MSDRISETSTIPFAAEPFQTDEFAAGVEPFSGSSVGLDIGTEEVRSVRASADGLRSRRQAMTYTIVPDSREASAMLAAAGVRFARAEGSLLVMGDAAVTVSTSFDAPAVPALPQGRMPDSDPVGRQVLALLIESALPPGTGVCALSLPAWVEPDRSLEAFVGNVVGLRGYRPLLVSGASAAGAALLCESGMTGLVVDFGASSIELSVIHHGRELDRRVIPAGGEALMRRIAESGRRVVHDRAGHRYRDLAGTRRWLQAGDRSILRPSSSEEARLAVDAKQLAVESANSAATLLATCGLPPERLTIVAIGGLTRLEGFCDQFADAVAAAGVAVPVRAAERDDGLITARGLLMIADSEQSGQLLAA